MQVMNKNNFPDEKEWKKIVEDAFSSDEEHIFSEHYKLNKQQMLRRVAMTKKTFNKICICPTMFIIEDGEPIAYWEAQGEYSVYNSILGLERQSMWFSLAMDSEHKGGKNHLILAPNESADVQIAFFVDDNVKDKIYVSFDVSGNNFGEYFDVSE
jgi:hypothetical protein